MTRCERSAKEKARKASSEVKKFGRKVDTYCNTFRTLEAAVADAAGIPQEELAAIRAGKQEITLPQRKRILDHFPNIKQL